ncbi:hypothetical protein JCM19237_289 [Photobacterium aphoticum]|uniref:Uncharacterized protein n=1 Tax=Photobacterium aphoticum TaxID=754436 RepID=A0A090R1C7_9GAMM|nr:hypothetical protein JCM19237_289 [Photobacterium aphoticum]
MTFIKPCDYEQERQFEVEHKYDYFYDHKDDTWGPAKNGEFK